MEIPRYQIPDGEVWEGVNKKYARLLKPFYRMCLRYNPSFFFEENLGNTVCHLAQKDYSIVFTFCKEKEKYSLCYLIYRAEQTREAWLWVMDDLAYIRMAAGGDRKQETESDRIFARYLEALQRDINWSPKPFSFIVSSLPQYCFPSMEGLRFYTPQEAEGIVQENLLIPLHAGDKGAKVFEHYELMRETTLAETRRLVKGTDWEVQMLERKNRKLIRKIGEPVSAGASYEALRLSEVENAATKLWKKAGFFK